MKLYDRQLFTFAFFLTQVCIASPRDPYGVYRRDNGTGPTVDLGYAVYQGAANGSTNLNTFKGSAP